MASSDCKWIQRCLRHEECKAVPYNFMFSPPVERIAREHYGQDLEEILLDVVLHPAFVEDLLEQLTVYIEETMRVLFATADFEGIALSDDYGTQQGLIMSPEHWRRLIKPRLARIYALAKKHRRTVFHHSCGNIGPIIGDLIDLGLDILHPIQPEAMDIRRLKSEFGRSLTFCGGIPTQYLLNGPAAPDRVRREVQRVKRDMAPGGGYILEPGITLQADIPRENLMALIDAARETS